jgi:hypothetical protein
MMRINRPERRTADLSTPLRGTGGVMGLRPIPGDEKAFGPTTALPRKRRPPFCHPERSRGICGSADLSWKHGISLRHKFVISTRRVMGLRPTQGDENAFCPRPLSHGSAALTLVISTEAQRSGEISVLTLLPGNVFRPEHSGVERSAVLSNLHV